MRFIGASSATFSEERSGRNSCLIEHGGEEDAMKRISRVGQYPSKIASMIDVVGTFL